MNSIIITLNLSYFKKYEDVKKRDYIESRSR